MFAGMAEAEGQQALRSYRQVCSRYLEVSSPKIPKTQTSALQIDASHSRPGGLLSVCPVARRGACPGAPGLPWLRSERFALDQPVSDSGAR